jgi:hypothetical protein
MCTKNCRSIRHSGIFHEFLQQSLEICFRTATSPNLTFFLLEAILGTKNKIKRIRRGHYSSNNFQDSTKEKLLKENMGYLPRVLFFNAFELGAVILKDAHISAIKELEAKESIKKQI